MKEHNRYIYHDISMSCRIDELSEEHQVTIIRLVNHLASMPDGYRQHAMKRVEKISCCELIKDLERMIILGSCYQN